MAVNSQKAKFGETLTYNSATGTGSYIAFSGTFADSPSLIIIQNDSNTTCTLSDDGVTNGLPVSAGKALVIDIQSDKGAAQLLSWRKGQQFFVKSAAGVGNFTISYIYAIT